MKNIFVTVFIFLVAGSILIASFVAIQTNLAPSDSSASIFGPKASLSDYWNGNAEWKLANKYTLEKYHDKWGPGYTTYTTIDTYNNQWLFLSRIVEHGHEECSRGVKISLELRTSSDKGVTFSAPVTLINADKNTPWECGATEGSLFFNQRENTWYLLVGCLGRDGIGNGCLFTRKNDLLGKFIPDPENPILKGGQLWSRICIEGSSCKKLVENKPIIDEGTFEIVEYKAPYYYVMFHGYANPYGLRGMALTKDFKKWSIIENASNEQNSILTLSDIKDWRESWINNKPIGVGAGSILKEGKYYYLLLEGSDINLTCENGQHWDFGLYRTEKLGTTKWEQLPQGNPIYYSSVSYDPSQITLPCNVQYGELFKSDGEVYMSIIRDGVEWKDRGVFVYKLEKTGNLLKNADLWKCDSSSWFTTADPDKSTSLVVYRRPELSSDANCYLATNCGADSCGTNQSIGQDINVKNLKKINFGAKISKDWGGKGHGSLVLWELEPTVKAHEIKINDLENNYKSYEKIVNISPQTTKLRFQLYLEDGISSVGSYRIDESFVIQM